MLVKSMTAVQPRCMMRPKARWIPLPDAPIEGNSLANAEETGEEAKATAATA